MARSANVRLGGVLEDSVRVKVEWSQVKRANLPAGGSYSTVARFNEDGAWPGGDTWSVVLLLPSVNEMVAGPFEAEARFLATDAPPDRLKPGTSFELFEGWTLVAKVVV